MEMDEWKMNINDLAAWFINYAKRLEVAEGLGCVNNPLHSDATCCIVHMNFHNELLHMKDVARRLLLFEEKEIKEIRLFSPNWWRELGQHEAAEVA